MPRSSLGNESINLDQSRLFILCETTTGAAFLKFCQECAESSNVCLSSADIRGDGSMVFTTIRDGRSQQVVAPVPAEFQGATVRFQAGDYQQANDSAGAQDGGRVIFHQLRKDPTS
jgi:hypothetical protein